MLQPGGVKSDKMYSILVTLVLVIVDHTGLMLPGVNLEVEEEQQQERGDAINHEVAVGEVILEWSKLENRVEYSYSYEVGEHYQYFTS